ncbi:MAG: hypothetical protein QOD06_977 [Candidatus Binatota bacterium]|nr:hypothetical protein [Candidatus Binatota bacterium]
MVVAAAAIAVALAVLELGVRLVTAFDRNYLDALVNRPPSSATRRLTLADLVRPSDDDRIVYELRPGVRGTFLGREVSVNRLGMRDDERGGDKPPGTVRIVGLGDSHMFGWGVDRREAFLAVLEEMLRERRPGRRFEAWNLAVPGYNSVQEVRTLERRMDAIDPDLVIISFIDNDMHLPNFLARRPDFWTLRRSYLAQLIRRRLATARGERLRPLDLSIMAPGEQRRPERELGRERFPERFWPLFGWKNLEQAYRRLAAVSRERRIPAIVVFVGTDPPDAESVRTLKALAAEEGIVSVDPRERILAYLRETGRKADRLVLSRRDPHANPQLHRLIAEAIFDTIVERGLLPPAPGPPAK